MRKQESNEQNLIRRPIQALGVVNNVAPPRNLAELFLGFLSIGARSFGGVMPLAYRVMVEERRWISAADFTETVGLCQFLPGPNVGNASVVLGKRWFGWRGSIVGFLGLVAVPFAWVLALAAFYSDYASIPAVRAIVIGVGAAGAGLFIGTAVKLGRPLASKPGAWVVAMACFLAIVVGRVSLLAVIPSAAAVAVLLSKVGWL
jgi:chromate transporter